MCTKSASVFSYRHCPTCAQHDHTCIGRAVRALYGGNCTKRGPTLCLGVTPLQYLISCRAMAQYNNLLKTYFPEECVGVNSGIGPIVEQGPTGCILNGSFAKT